MFQKIKDITPGKVDSIIVMIKAINTLKTRSGSPYQKVSVRDTEGDEATFLQFDVLLDFEAPAIIRATVECVQHGASLAMKMKDCVVTDEVGMDAFLPKAHIIPKEGWSAVIQTTKTIRNSLCRVLCAIIAEDKNKFLTLPLNPYGPFARQSGVLEATTKLMALAETAATTSTSIDRDLLVTGALLYYIGNLNTIDEGYNFTTVDVMYGPSIAAYTRVQTKSMELIASSEDAKKDISGEDVMLLSHILAVKSGAVEPAIPEAVILKNLDKMLQETDEMVESIATAETQISTDEFGKRVYKRM